MSAWFILWAGHIRAQFHVLDEFFELFISIVARKVRFFGHFFFCVHVRVSFLLHMLCGNKKNPQRLRDKGKEKQSLLLLYLHWASLYRVAFFSTLFSLIVLKVVWLGFIHCFFTTKVYSSTSHFWRIYIMCICVGSYLSARDSSPILIA